MRRWAFSLFSTLQLVLATASLYLLLIVMDSPRGHAYLLSPGLRWSSSFLQSTTTTATTNHHTSPSSHYLPPLASRHSNHQYSSESRPQHHDDGSMEEERYDPRLMAHGRHICIDYTNFYIPAQEGGDVVIDAMRQAVAEAGVREVHSHMVVLGQQGESPPGFTAVCLIDESHVTAHCYSDKGWLAIDVFTCGSHPPEIVADLLHAKLLHHVPDLMTRRRATLPRFLHPLDSPPTTISMTTIRRFTTTASGNIQRYP